MGKNILKITVFAMIALLVFSCKKESITPTGVTLTPAILSIDIGGTDTIKATISPTNASGIVTWSSSNTSVATVNSSGIVTGIAIGSAVITATTTDGNKTATCAVTITKWTSYAEINGYVWSIAFDAQGNKWFGTAGYGVFKFDGTNWTSYSKDNSGLASNYINVIAIDAQGNKWIATRDSGVSKFDGVNWTVYNTKNSGIAGNNVTGFAIDSQGNKWFGTADVKYNENCGCITLTGTGISKFDGSNWTTYNTSNSGLPDNYITVIAIDAQDNKWIGAYEAGLSKFDGINWITYNEANSGILNNFFTSVGIDAQGNKWIGTGGGVSKFDGTNWTTYTTANSGLSSNVVKSIAIDNHGNKWFGTLDNGVSKFDGTNWTTYNKTNSGIFKYSNTGFFDNDVLSIAIDALGNKWFGGSGISELQD